MNSFKDGKEVGATAVEISWKIRIWQTQLYQESINRLTDKQIYRKTTKILMKKVLYIKVKQKNLKKNFPKLENKQQSTIWRTEGLTNERKFLTI